MFVWGVFTGEYKDCFSGVLLMSDINRVYLGEMKQDSQGSMFYSGDSLLFANTVLITPLNLSAAAMCLLKPACL